MSDLANRPSRAVREQRAFRLVMLGGTSAVVGVVGLILAVAGVIGSGVPIIALIVAAVCFVMFRGMTRKR